MFCRECGKEIADNSVFCNYCGAATDNVSNTAAQQPIQPQQGQYIPPYPQQYQHAVDPDEPVSGAIIAVCILLPIIGIILGCVFMSDGRKAAGKTYIIASLISIGISLLIAIIVGIIIVASIPSFYYWF